MNEDDKIFHKAAKVLNAPFVYVKWDMPPITIIKKLLEVIENGAKEEKRGER